MYKIYIYIYIYYTYIYIYIYIHTKYIDVYGHFSRKGDGRNVMLS